MKMKSLVLIAALAGLFTTQTYAAETAPESKSAETRTDIPEVKGGGVRLYRDNKSNDDNRWDGRPFTTVPAPYSKLDSKSQYAGKLKDKTATGKKRAEAILAGTYDSAAGEP